MGLNDSANNLVSAIKSTREYNEFIQSKKAIERNSLLKNQVIEFSKKLGEIYSSNKSASMIEAKVSELNRQFDSLFKIPEVERFNKATKSFNEMMAKMFKSMNDSLNAEMRLN